MPIHNEDIADIFAELADLLEIEGANPFRVRAYRNAARTVSGMGRELTEWVAQGTDLTQLPGIGKDLAHKIQEIVNTGTTSVLDEIHKTLPPTLEQLLRIPGLGPKKVKTLYEALGVQDLTTLEQAARAGRLRTLPGFGVRTEEKILETIVSHRKKKRRFLRSTAMHYAEPLAQYLRTAPEVREVVVAGSYRRGRETVGDLDILVTSDGPGDVIMDWFSSYDEVIEVVSKGPTRSTVILRCGLQVDLRVVEADSLGPALHYFTGSKAHNIQIRRLGQHAGLKINEYGVFQGERQIAGRTEESVVKALGLPWIPPELREARGEIDAARLHELPHLIERDDLKGSLHNHTTASDGHATLKEMARGARKQGLEYLAITEHSRSLTVANGLDPDRLLTQIEEIDQFNARASGITLLKGIEVDILEDGDLDLPDTVLRRLDLVVGAVHSHFGLSRTRQTERVLRAMDHRYFSILAHPTGRLLLEREPYEVDLEGIIEHARQRGCFLELNAQPSRLDLTDVYCRMARDEGVLVAIDSDAHSVDDLDNLQFGISQARRGWLERRDVLNTRTLDQLRPLLRQTMG